MSMLIQLILAFLFRLCKCFLCFLNIFYMVNRHLNTISGSKEHSRYTKSCIVCRKPIRVVIEYITEVLGGVIGEEYAEPTGDVHLILS